MPAQILSALSACMRLRCEKQLPELANAFGQNEHLYGLSPVCWLMWNCAARNEMQTNQSAVSTKNNCFSTYLQVLVALERLAAHRALVRPHVAVRDHVGAQRRIGRIDARAVRTGEALARVVLLVALQVQRRLEPARTKACRPKPTNITQLAHLDR